MEGVTQVTNIEKYNAIMAELSKLKPTAQEADDNLNVSVMWGEFLQRIEEIVNN